MSHTFIIPGSIYAPQAPHRLLSPQHWSQAANDNHPTTNGTWCATYSDHIILYWSQCNSKRTISLDRSTNTALSMTSATKDKLYLSVEWAFTTRTEWPRGASETFRTAQGPCSSTPTEDVPTPSVSTCGHMHYAMPHASEMLPPMKRERRPLVQPLLGLKENPDSLHFILLVVQSTFWMQECSEDRKFLNGRRALALVSIYASHHLMHSQSHWCSTS
jgi:hypothetical protein